MNKLILPFLIAFIFCFGCKKDKALDISLLDDDYYSAFVYRDYPKDLSLDTFTYYFHKDTLTIIGYTFERVNDIQTPVKIDTISHSYFIEDNNIYFPPQTEDANKLYNYRLVGPYEYHLLHWEIIEFNNSKLIIEGHLSDKVISHFELIANAKK